MRFQLTKNYRAHPELDGYSDEECYRLMLQAHSRRADAMWIVPLGLILAMLIVCLSAAAFVAWTVHSSRVNAGLMVPFWANPAVRTIFSWAFLVMGPAAVVIWILTRRELIMRSVLNHLVKARCPYCLFSLEGLKIEMGAVICPECGEQIVLKEEGISPEDLLPRQSGAYRTWKPEKQDAVELPPIPLEPDPTPEKKKRIHGFGVKRG